MSQLLRSPLHDRHAALAAKTAEFGGWEMPLEYPGGGVLKEHAAVREAVYRRSLPLATRTLRIEFSTLGRLAGLTGAVHLVLDELFAPHRLAQWLPRNSPAGNPELVAA